MEITLGRRTIDKRNMPRYAHFECNLSLQESRATLIMGKDLLRDNGVKRIRFRAPGTVENFDVKWTEEYIQLVPSYGKNPAVMRFQAREVSGIRNPLKLWFYPENTVILKAEGASKDVVLAGRMEELAKRLGLQPLATVMPNHQSTHKLPEEFYFIDTKGHYPNAKGELLDYIQADVMKYGLEADEPAQKSVAVFIRKPGQYD